MYAMQITEDTAEFIGRYFNDGVVPQVGAIKTFFIFGDDTSSEIMTERNFVLRYDFRVVRHCALFTFEDPKDPTRI
jgi:hypothetical protein